MRLTVGACVGVPPAVLVELEGAVTGGRGADAASGRLLQAGRDVYHVIFTCRHNAPPIVGVRTLYKQHGKIYIRFQTKLLKTLLCVNRKGSGRGLPWNRATQIQTPACLFIPGRQNCRLLNFSSSLCFYI